MRSTFTLCLIVILAPLSLQGLKPSDDVLIIFASKTAKKFQGQHEKYDADA